MFGLDARHVDRIMSGTAYVDVFVSDRSSENTKNYILNYCVINSHFALFFYYYFCTMGYFRYFCVHKLRSRVTLIFL